MGTVVVPPTVNDPLVFVSVIPRPVEFAVLTFLRGGASALPGGSVTRNWGIGAVISALTLGLDVPSRF
jgi:hypothetical protein